MQHTIRCLNQIIMHIRMMSGSALFSPSDLPVVIPQLTPENDGIWMPSIRVVLTIHPTTFSAMPILPAATPIHFLHSEALTQLAKNFFPEI